MVKTGIHSRRLGSGRQLHRGKNYVKDLKLGIRLSQARQPEKAPKKGGRVRVSRCPASAALAGTAFYTQRKIKANLLRHSANNGSGLRIPCEPEDAAPAFGSRIQPGHSAQHFADLAYGVGGHPRVEQGEFRFKLCAEEHAIHAVALLSGFLER